MATTGTVTQLGTVEPVAERAAFAWKGVLAVSFGFAAIMGIAAARINYFGDELYFVAAGQPSSPGPTPTRGRSRRSSRT